MWLDVNTLRGRWEGWLASLGRALLVAQYFESMVKRTLYVDDVARAIVAMPYQEAIPYVEAKLERPEAEPDYERILDRAIKSLQRRRDIPSESVETLVEAKNARNAVAHEMALRIVGLRQGVEDETEFFFQYRGHVRSLAKGYNLLSWWAIRSEEPESSPIGHFRRYPQILEAWVLEPIVDLLPRESGSAMSS